MNLDSLLDFKDTQSPVFPGDLMIAEPLMRDDIFRRAVVLVLDAPGDDKQQNKAAADAELFDEAGIMGLILNNKSQYTLANLMSEWAEGERIPLYIGGPVELERLFMLHTMGDRFPGSTEIAKGIFVGGKLDDIVDYINNGGQIEGKMRFFLGYTGWGSGQLQQERDAKVWAHSSADLRAPEDAIQLLRGEGNSFWRREVERLGNDYRNWLNVPEDPTEN